VIGAVRVRDWRPLIMALLIPAAALPLLALPELFETVAMGYALVALTAFVCFAPLVVLYRQGRLTIASLGLWFAVTYFLHFGLGTIVSAVHGSRFLGLDPASHSFFPINLAAAVAIAGILFFWVGYLSSAGPRVAAHFRPMPAKWNVRTAFFVGVACFGFGMCIRVAMMVLHAGGIGAWLAGNKDEFLLASEGMMYVNAFTNFATIGVFVLLATALFSRDRTVFWCFLAAFLVELGFKMLSGSRSAAVYLILQVFILYFLMKPRDPVRERRAFLGAAAMIPLFVMMYPLTTSLRFGGIMDPFKLWRESPYLVTSEGLAYIIGERFHGVDSLALVQQKVPAEMPYDLGSHFGRIVYTWVPRAVWPEKPQISMGMWFHENLVPAGLYPPGAAVAITLPGEMYLSWGIFGVTLGLLVIGVFWRSMQIHLFSPRGNPSTAVAAAFIFPTFLMAVEQDFNFPATFGLVNYVLVVSVVFYIGWRSRLAARPPAEEAPPT
jgi:hypothetical protein